MGQNGRPDLTDPSMSCGPLHMKRHRQGERGSDCGDKAVAVAVAQQFTVGVKALAA